MAVPPLLEELLRAPAPTGSEEAAMAVWRRAAAEHAELETDALGNTIARLRGGAEERPLVALTAHLDEIGVIVTHVSEQGLLSVGKLGGVPPAHFVGQRVELAGRAGPVPGVVGRAGDGEKVEWAELYVDVGAASRDEALALVGPGDAGVFLSPPIELAGGRFASKALDDRIGAYVVAEVLRRLAGEPPRVGFAAVGTVREENGEGATVAVRRLAPDAVVTVDVTFDTGLPGQRPEKLGLLRVGGGPSIFRGPVVHPLLARELIAAAEAEGIAYSVESAASSDTEAESVLYVGEGTAAAVVSVPVRAMHTANEVAQLSDVEDCIRMLTAFVRRLEPGTSFLR